MLYAICTRNLNCCTDSESNPLHFRWDEDQFVISPNVIKPIGQDSRITIEFHPDSWQRVRWPTGWHTGAHIRRYARLEDFRSPCMERTHDRSHVATRLRYFSRIVIIATSKFECHRGFVQRTRTSSLSLFLQSRSFQVIDTRPSARRSTIPWQANRC